MLTSFLSELLTTGAVTLASKPAPFSADDQQGALALLRAAHADDACHLPLQAPAFDAEAAAWAAAYLFHAIQLTLVRELDESVIAACLADFGGERSPAAIYSADLTLRYLPDVLHLARGLAPGDVLVARLHDTLRRWPFSGVGTGPAEPEAEAAVLSHPALRLAYVDRIIGARDRARAGQPSIHPLVQAALGRHAPTLWPDFAAFILPSS